MERPSSFSWHLFDNLAACEGSVDTVHEGTCRFDRTYQCVDVQVFALDRDAGSHSFDFGNSYVQTLNASNRVYCLRYFY